MHKRLILGAAIFGLILQVLPQVSAQADGITSSNVNVINFTHASGANTNMIAVTSTGDVWVSEDGGNHVYLFDKSATGTATPKKVISGLNYPSGLAVDSADNLYVSTGYTGKIYVFPSNVPTVATSSDATRTINSVTNSFSIAVAADGYIFAAVGFGHLRVNVYAPGTTNAASSSIARTFTTPGVANDDAQGIGISPTGDIAVATANTNFVAVFNSSDSGTVTPKQLIQGSNTELNAPGQIAFDTTGHMYVANYSTPKVLIFDSTATGNVVPLKSITGTGITSPWGIGLGTDSNIWIANWDQINIASIANPFISTPSPSPTPSPTATETPKPSYFTRIAYPAISKSKDSLVCHSGTYTFSFQGNSEGPAELTKQVMTLLANGKAIKSLESLAPEATFAKSDLPAGNTYTCEQQISEKGVTETFSSINLSIQRKADEALRIARNSARDAFWKSVSDAMNAKHASIDELISKHAKLRSTPNIGESLKVTGGAIRTMDLIIAAWHTQRNLLSTTRQLAEDAALATERETLEKAGISIFL